MTGDKAESQAHEWSDAQVRAAWQVLADRGLVGIEWQGLVPVGWVDADLLPIVAARLPESYAREMKQGPFIEGPIRADHPIRDGQSRLADVLDDASHHDQDDPR